MIKTHVIRVLVLLVAQLYATACSDERNAIRSEPFDFWVMSATRAGEVGIAVGGTPDAGTILEQRPEAQSWEAVPLPENTPLVNWAHPAGSRTFAVGNDGTILERLETGWVSMSSPTTDDLWGVWGSSAESVYAVGGSGQRGDAPVLLRFDGDSWEQLDVPELSRPQVAAFFKVWGFGDDEVYVVGQRGVVMRFDGVAWSEMESGTEEDLISLWGVTVSGSSTGEATVVAVGGRANGVIATLSDDTWTTAPLVGTPGLNGVWAEADTAYIAGNRGTLGTFDIPSAVFSLAETRAGEVDSAIDLHAVSGGTRANRRLAVGGNLAFASGPYQGAIITWR